MAEIKKIQLPNGNTYDIVDAGARALIEEMAGSTSMLGVTTTALTDGSTTNPVTIGGVSTRAFNGDMVIYHPSQNSSKEFVWVATIYSIWQKSHPASDEWVYTKVASPTQQQSESAVYVRKTEAELTATQTTPLDYPLAFGADYVKVEASGTSGYGSWSEFGDLSTISLNKGDGAYVVGQNATFDVGDPTIALELKETSTSGSGMVEVVTGITSASATAPSVSLSMNDQTQPAGAVQIADGSIDAFSVELSSSSSASETATQYVQSVSPDSQKFLQKSLGKTSASSVATGNPKRLATGSLSLEVQNNALVISTAGQGNSITFATGAANVNGTGAEIVTPSEVSTVSNLATTTAAVDVLTPGLAGPDDPGVTLVKSVGSTGKYLSVTKSLTLGKSYLSANAGQPTVTVTPTKKKVKGTASGGSVIFQNADLTHIAKYEDLSIGGTN